MDGEVFQDNVMMSQIAQELESDATKYNQLIEEIYDLLSSKLGMDDDGQKAWYGPRANEYLASVNQKRQDFDTAKDNILLVAKNLQTHAEAWHEFESKA